MSKLSHLPWFKRQYLIEIIFKSGKSTKFWCLDFAISRQEVQWTYKGYSRPLAINVDEIAGAFCRKSRIVFC